MNKLLFAVALVAAQASGQTSNGANPLSSNTKKIYGGIKNYVLKSAEEMPEENYSFRPVSSVRTFGQLVAHVADAQYEFCSAVVGDGNRGPGVEKNKKTKAEIIQALRDAFAYCDPAYDNMTDEHASDLVNFFGDQMPKLIILNYNIDHNSEHYGNMITYLRMKGLTPPSSQKGGQ